MPAILSPKLFALREEHADQRTERTLKLTSKVIRMKPCLINNSIVMIIAIVLRVI